MCKDIVLRHAQSALIHRPESELRRREALVSGPPIPLHCLRIVLRTAASIVQAAEPILRGGVALVGGETKLLGRFSKALCYAFTVGIHTAEVVLRGCVASVGQRAKKPKGGCIVVSCISGFSILKRSSNGGSRYRWQHER